MPGGLVTMSNSFDPKYYSHQAPLSIGFLGQEYWSGLPFPSPRDLSNHRTKFPSSAWQGDSFSDWVTSTKYKTVCWNAKDSEIKWEGTALLIIYTMLIYKWRWLLNYYFIHHLHLKLGKLVLFFVFFSQLADVRDILSIEDGGGGECVELREKNE